VWSILRSLKHKIIRPPYAARRYQIKIVVIAVCSLQQLTGFEKKTDRQIYTLQRSSYQIIVAC
jgi:hypothetical protein